MSKIIVDSGCDYSEQLIGEKGLEVELIPLMLQLENKTYVDDGNLDVSAYLDDMEKSPQIPKTSAPSPELFMEKFKGVEKIFTVTLSRHLSSSYNSAMLAKELYLEEMGQKFIHVFDSLSASVGEIIVAMRINELIKNNLTDNEVVEQVNRYINGLKTFFILEKYDTLIKSGRINPYIAKLASLLSIKPICAGVEGVITFVDKARGFDNAAKKLVDIMAREKVDFENRILGISHVKCPEKAMSLKKEIADRINFKEIFIVEARGIVATYANRGGIVLSY